MTWIIAILVNISALLGYIIKWFPIRDIDPYYWTGMLSHILVILPMLFGLKYYKLDIVNNILKLKKDQYLSITATVFLLILYFIIQNNIYIDTKWKDILETE